MSGVSVYYVTTKQLTVGYDGVPLIHDITIDIARGEIVTLIGPNGSGKSTILKSITRQLRMIDGRVFIDFRELRELSYKELSTKMAVVLTERMKPELMTCRDIVATGRYPYTGRLGILSAGDEAKVEEAMAAVHALEIRDRDFNAISDGQRQRVLLARAICQEPEIIILDEPTSFLDIRHKLQLLSILRKMAKEKGITVIMSLHEIDLAEKISDRIVCVKGDRIAAYGTPEEIFAGSTIAELYDIDGRSYDSLLGKMELSAPEGKIRCFVIGGNGTGIPFYRELQKKGVPFAAGVLMPNDIDVSVASALAGRLICTAPFMPADDASLEEAERLVDVSEFVVVCGCPVGEFNRVNGMLEQYAESNGKKIVRSLAAMKEVLS